MKTSLTRVVDLTSTRAPAAAGKALDDVCTHQDSTMFESRFEEGGRCPRVDDLARFRQCFRDMPMVVSDEMTAWISLARQLTDLVPGVENCLKRFVGRRCEVTFVTVIPEPQMALRPGNITGLGELGFVDHVRARVAEIQGIQPIAISLQLRIFN